MKENNPHILGTEKVGKLLLEYSIPAIIGMTLTSLYNIIDSVFIGHGVGAMAISGLAISFPLMNLLVAFCTLVGVGGATISSIRLGQKDTDGAEKVPDKFARAGFHATRSEFVDAPLIDELSVAVECKLKDYNPETCILRGEIVNVSVDERVLDQNGKVDASKVIPVIFDPFNNDYLKVGEKVGNAFSDGKALK